MTSFQTFVKEITVEFADWIAENVDGSYLIDGQGKFEMSGREGLLTSSELFDAFIEDVNNAKSKPTQKH